MRHTRGHCGLVFSLPNGPELIRQRVTADIESDFPFRHVRGQDQHVILLDPVHPHHHVADLVVSRLVFVYFQEIRATLDGVLAIISVVYKILPFIPFLEFPVLQHFAQLFLGRIVYGRFILPPHFGLGRLNRRAAARKDHGT